jgi:hypothetical protein
MVSSLIMPLALSSSSLERDVDTWENNPLIPTPIRIQQEIPTRYAFSFFIVNKNGQLKS